MSRLYVLVLDEDALAALDEMRSVIIDHAETEFLETEAQSLALRAVAERVTLLRKNAEYRRSDRQTDLEGIPERTLRKLAYNAGWDDEGTFRDGHVLENMPEDMRKLLRGESPEELLRRWIEYEIGDVSWWSSIISVLESLQGAERLLAAAEPSPG